MHLRSSFNPLIGLAALSVLVSPVSAQEAAPSAVSAPVIEAALSKANASLPSYVQKRYTYHLVINTIVVAKDRYDKQPFMGGTVVMMQSCPPGYVGANSPTIHNYPMQRVVTQRFTVNGEELPFVKTPNTGQTGFWTLGKERDNGWDTNILVFRLEAGGTIRLRAEYDGINGTSVYEPRAKTGQMLSPQELKKFLKLDEAVIKTTKSEMDDALISQGLLRRPGESAVQYAVRVAEWTNDESNLPRRLGVNGDGINNDFPFSIKNHVGGNCNQIADEQVYALRSQGVPARIVSGIDSDWNEGGERYYHVFAEMFDQDCGRWLRIGQSPTDSQNAAVTLSNGQPNLIPFQIDTTFKYPRDYSRSAASSTGCGEWMVGENGKYVANIMSVIDTSAAWFRPVVTP